MISYVCLLLTLNLFEDVTCNDAKFGDGGEGDVSEIQCGPKKNGYIIASCEGAVWVVKKNTCVLTVILNLQNNSEVLYYDTPLTTI